MNYEKLYNSIIENRKRNPASGYTENHHIIPRSLGGSDSDNNLIRLTAREHFLCHLLLVKLHSGPRYYKMVRAFIMMGMIATNQQRYINSRLYEHQRIVFSKIQSVSQIGTLNSNYGKHWYYNPITKESKVFKDPAPLGWVLGRGKDNELTKKNRLTEIEENKIKRQTDRLLEARRLLDLYKASGCKSLNEFCKKGYYKYSLVSLTKIFQLLPQYKDAKQGVPFRV